MTPSKNPVYRPKSQVRSFPINCQFVLISRWFFCKNYDLYCIEDTFQVKILLFIVGNDLKYAFLWTVLLVIFNDFVHREIDINEANITHCGWQGVLFKNKLKIDIWADGQSEPNSSTHGDIGWGWASEESYPKVRVRLSQGHSKVKTAKNVWKKLVFVVFAKIMFTWNESGFRPPLCT